MTPLTPLLERLPLHREVVLGPARLTGGTLVMRSPRLRDAAAWSAARRANRTWLEGAFPAWGDDWDAEQSPVAWVARWWHLQRVRRTEGARPFVLLLDGRLIGELGIDAVDTTNGGGEGAVWMVRDHPPQVMNVASLLLIRYVFGEPDPMDRLLSPVSVASSKGRAPGLRAVGFDLEATLPRPVGVEPSVDHDIWVLHNSPAARAKTDQVLAAMAAGSAPPDPHRSTRIPTRADVAVVAPAVLRASLRGLRTAVREARAGRHAVEVPTRRTEVEGVPVTVEADGTVRRGERPVGRVETRSDLGTATATLRPRPDGPPDPAALTAAVAVVADDVAAWAPHARWVEVRLAPAASSLAEHLGALGFAHVATFRGNPDGPRRWTGEHVWTRAVS